MRSLRLVRAVALKEVRELVRDPVTLIVAVLLPLVLLFVFAYGLNVDVHETAMAVLDRDGSPDSREFVARVDRTDEFGVVVRLDDMERVPELLDRGTVRLVLVIPPGFSEALRGGERVAVQTLLDGSYSATAQVFGGYLDALTATFARDRLGREATRGAAADAGPAVADGAAAGVMAGATPRIETRVWYNPSLSSRTSVVSGLFGVILMAFPPLLTALAVVREKERGSIRHIRLASLRPWQFVIGKMLPYAALAFADMLLILAAGMAWFRVPLRGSFLFLAGASLLYVVATVSIGLFVSTITRTQVVALLLVIVLTVMPSFMFSGFLFPIFAMPWVLQLYTYLFPGRYFVELSRGIFLKGVGIDVLYPQVVLLVLYATALLSVASFRLRHTAVD